MNPRHQRAITILGLAGLLALPGCMGPKGPPKPPGPPRQMNEIIDAVEANTQLLNQALWSNNASISARFVDDKGKRHSYNLDGNLLFQSPRNLRLDLRPGLGNQVMQIGSNADDFWIWIEPEAKTMWWGRYRNVGQPCARRITVRPDQLVAALGLGGLPAPGDGLIGPELKSSRTMDVLSYVRGRPGEGEGSPGGGSPLAREYQIDRSPPYLIRGVQFHDERGHVVTRSTLDDYRQAWAGGPWVARKIRIEWPAEDGRFEMSIRSFTAMPPDKVSSTAFDRPWGERMPRGINEVIQVDAECD